MEQQQILIVSDLNGTLLHSTHHKVASEVEPDIKARTKYIYYRPHMHEFVNALAEHPRIRLAVWTSCKQENARAIVKEVFKEVDLEYCLSRGECTILNKEGDTAKDLSKIWIESNGKWNEKNTFLIDDSDIKAQKQPNNHIKIPEYDVSNKQTDNALEVIKEIILKKVESKTV